MTSESWREMRQGWPVLAGCLLGSSAATFHANTLGLFLKPIAQQTGWTNATITFGILVASILAVPGAPFAGWLAERFGVEKIIMIGLPLFLAACAFLGVLSGSPAQWIAGWTIVAVFSTLLKNNVWMLWTAQNFINSRGLAFAIVISGSSIFSIFMPYLVQLSIEHFGWRTTYPILACGIALVALPVCYLATRYSAAAKQGTDALRLRLRRDAHTGMTLGEAARLRHFWQILFTTFLLGCAFTSFQIYLVPMLQERMNNAHAVALIAGSFGVSALFGRFVSGLLLDRFPGHIVGGLNLVPAAIGCLLYLFVPVNTVVALAIAIALGVGVGAEGDVIGYITSRYFGMRSFGPVYGLMASGMALGAGVGPFGLSVMHDHFGSYNPIVLALLAGVLLVIVLVTTLGRYPDRLEQPAEAEADPIPLEAA
jgi:MFS family permease